jgi:hypothetical protein
MIAAPMATLRVLPILLDMRVISVSLIASGLLGWVRAGPSGT